MLWTFCRIAWPKLNYMTVWNNDMNMCVDNIVPLLAVASFPWSSAAAKTNVNAALQVIIPNSWNKVVFFFTSIIIASHADVLTGWSRNHSSPTNVRGAAKHDEPLRMSAWEATIIIDYKENGKLGKFCYWLVVYILCTLSIQKAF